VAAGYAPHLDGCIVAVQKVQSVPANFDSIVVVEDADDNVDHLVAVAVKQHAVVVAKVNDD